MVKKYFVIVFLMYVGLSSAIA
ncbi:MAG: hypothetical protein RIS47_2315, partial [Bacteroidota bacterium]